MSKIVGVRRGTALYAKGREKVEAILDAALAVLVEGGSENFSMNRVAARAGMRLSHIQYYFPHRLDLLKALLQGQLASYKKEMEEFLAEKDPSPRKKLSKALDYILAVNQSQMDNSLMWNIWAMSCHNDQVLEIMDDFYCVYRETYRRLIADCVPEMDRGRQEEIAAIAVSILEGASLITGAGRPTHAELSELDTAIRDTILRLVFND